jgi:hypothetical protein
MDITSRTIHQFWSPAAEGFGQRREVELGGAIASATLADLNVNTAGV